MIGSETQMRRRKFFSINKNASVMLNGPTAKRQLRAANAGGTAEVQQLDAPRKFPDAAQTFSLYTISLGLVPDSLFEGCASKASRE